MSALDARIDFLCRIDAREWAQWDEFPPRVNGLDDPECFSFVGPHPDWRFDAELARRNRQARIAFEAERAAVAQREAIYAQSLAMFEQAMPDEQPRPRGRPRLTDEQKAKRRELREATWYRREQVREMVWEVFGGVQ